MCRGRMWNATRNLAILKFHTGCAKGIREGEATSHRPLRTSTNQRAGAVDSVQASLAEQGGMERGESNGAV